MLECGCVGVVEVFKGMMGFARVLWGLGWFGKG